jgi:hypothetical protein
MDSKGVSRMSGRHARVFGLFIACCFAFVSVGCGGGKKATVSGKINYRGKPLPTGTVTFFGATNQIVGSGAISDGTYKLANVPVGPVKISVTTPPVRMVDPRHPAPKDMPGSPSGPSVPIPPKYSNPEQSQLSYEVKSGTQEYPIDLN